MKKLKKVTIPLFREPNMKEYFETISTGEKLKQQERPCDGCAVTTGFYQPYAEELAKQESELQDKVLGTWYCHNHLNKTCRGAYNYIQNKNNKKT